MVKVSIIVPIYNTAQYLHKCIDGILSQTLTDIEIILASDGPDDCDQICNDYAASDSRVRVVLHQKSYGKSVNKSIEIARGEYIGIVESDDWIEPNMFEKLYNFAKIHDADFCKAAFTCFFDDASKNYTVYTDIAEGEFELEKYPRILSYQPSIWSAVYKKSFLNENKIRFIEDRISFVDADFTYQVFLKSAKTVFLPEPLYWYNLDNPEQSVKREIFDGITVDEISFKKLKIEDLSQGIYEAFLFAFYLHFDFGITCLMRTYTSKKKFWSLAHDFIRTASQRQHDLREFTFEQKTIFRMLCTYRNYSVARIAMALFEKKRVALDLVKRLLGQKD